MFYTPATKVVLFCKSLFLILGMFSSAAYSQEGTGGIVTIYDDDGVTYRVHTFTSDGTFVANEAIPNLDYLIVGGGGGGGASAGVSGVPGAGGGGGGLIQGNTLVIIDNYTVTVGSGGAGAIVGASVSGSNGTDSSLFGFTAVGGGGGGSRTLGSTTAPGAGGSGGGGVYSSADGGSGTIDQGFAGGDGALGPYAAGGGGAGGAGASAVTGGAGGPGLAWVDGNFYSGGGGRGGATNTAFEDKGAGGIGGGGAGGAGGGDAGISGVNGGGGGGGGANSGGDGGAGGAGVVVVRYPIVAPTVAITGVPASSNAAFTATFTFSEDVTGFAVGDITVGNGAASAFDATSAPVYTALITPASDGAVTVDVAANVATDTATNPNTAATQATSTFDGSAPTVAITGVPASSTTAFTATFTFSEDVTGFAVGDITVGNGAASAFDATSAPVYTALITPASDGAVTVDVAANVATDTATNPNTAATQATSTFDTTVPRQLRSQAFLRAVRRPSQQPLPSLKM